MKTTFFAFLAGLAVTYAAAVPVSTPQTSLPGVGNVAAVDEIDNHPNEALEAVTDGGPKLLERQLFITFKTWTDVDFSGPDKTWYALNGECSM
jgi:hypothetical protein